MPLEIRELTIRAVVAEPASREESGDTAPGTDPVDQKRLLDLAMQQVEKLLKDKEER